jgi:hypothetical protein
VASASIRTFAVTLGLMTAITCSSTSSITSQGGTLALGTWGGEEGALIVGDTAAHLHVGCTFGDIHGRIVLDAAGHFEGDGSYLLRAYPIAVGPTMPAHFSLQLNGNTLTALATVDDTVGKTTVVRGPVTLTLGVAPKMANCPICRSPYRNTGSPE